MGSNSTWRKAKIALGLNHCIFMSSSSQQQQQQQQQQQHAVDVLSYAADHMSSSSSSGPTFSKTRSDSSRSSKGICSICLGSMKPGDGYALFTAECSHTFHFHCIASNVRHGNHVCPICRARWKEIPLQGLGSSDLPQGRPSRVSPVNLPQEDDYTTIVRMLPRSSSINQQQHLRSIFNISEPSSFDDDEPLDPQAEPVNNFENEHIEKVEIKTHPEFSAIPQSASQENFAVLIHLKAPISSSRHLANMPMSKPYSAPLDLVTVLDLSGSMLGTKLALLKRAMGFVIQNLGPADRLSVVVFSSTARRLFHLRRMSESGRWQSLQAVNSLVCSGGTNIAEGLRKGAKVIEERKEKNPVCSLILLSDGQDTYMLPSCSDGAQHSRIDYNTLLPSSIHAAEGPNIPVHAFGFGSDHDSALMHTISEISGGTYSFVETEGVIQDAFAQCIGGLMSVVVQELRVGVECVHSDVQICSIKSGSYTSCIADDRRSGSINVGDLYADEERDFLVSVNVNIVNATCEEVVPLLKVACVYTYPVTNESVNLEEVEVEIQRPQEGVIKPTLSIEVDRQRNRLQAAEAMVEARAAAERGVLSEAVTILGNCQQSLADSIAGRSGDSLCMALDEELREMQERMASRQRYEASGRAYVLSGLSSHSWQRVTARGNSTESSSRLQSYRTASMDDMLQRSRNMAPAAQRSSQPIHPCHSMPKSR